MDLFVTAMLFFCIGMGAGAIHDALVPEKLWKRDYLAERKRADDLERQVRELQHELEKMKEATQ